MTSKDRQDLKFLSGLRWIRSSGEIFPTGAQGYQDTGPPSLGPCGTGTGALDNGHVIGVTRSRD